MKCSVIACKKGSGRDRGWRAWENILSGDVQGKGVKKLCAE